LGLSSPHDIAYVNPAFDIKEIINLNNQLF